MRREIYSGRLKLHGQEDSETLLAGFNYAVSLRDLRRLEEAKSLFRKMLPVARRVLGETNILTLRTRWLYANTLYMDASATLDDVREAVETLENTEWTARRVLGGAHPIAEVIEQSLRRARAALAAREEETAAA